MRFFQAIASAVRCIGRPRRRNLSFITVADREQHIFGVVKIAAFFAVVFEDVRYDIDLTKCIFCGFCEESCPVDAIVETHILEYHGEKRGDLYYTKEMLLAVGDRYENEIAAARAADAAYR